MPCAARRLGNITQQRMGSGPQRGREKQRQANNHFPIPQHSHYRFPYNPLEKLPSHQTQREKIIPLRRPRHPQPYREKRANISVGTSAMQRTSTAAICNQATFLTTEVAPRVPPEHPPTRTPLPHLLSNLLYTEIYMGKSLPGDDIWFTLPKDFSSTFRAPGVFLCNPRPPQKKR